MRKCGRRCGRLVSCMETRKRRRHCCLSAVAGVRRELIGRCHRRLILVRGRRPEWCSRDASLHARLSRQGVVPSGRVKTIRDGAELLGVRSRVGVLDAAIRQVVAGTLRAEDFPPLREGHLAWFVIDAVDAIDLAAVYAAYRQDGHGRAAYARGVRSSRRKAWQGIHPRRSKRPLILRSACPASRRRDARRPSSRRRTARASGSRWWSPSRQRRSWSGRGPWRPWRWSRCVPATNC
jgi:hypothetical protein